VGVMECASCQKSGIHRPGPATEVPAGAGGQDGRLGRPGPRQVSSPTEPGTAIGTRGVRRVPGRGVVITVFTRSVFAGAGASAVGTARGRPPRLNLLRFPRFGGVA